MELKEALQRHDQTNMSQEDFVRFKALCAYQLGHNPDLSLRPAFRHTMKQKTLTNGAAGALAPFMVSACDET